MSKKKFLLMANASACLCGEYIPLVRDFGKWLELMGYSALSVPALVAGVRGFLGYQQECAKTSIRQLRASDANRFIQALQTRTGVRTGRPFSCSHINKQIQALKLLDRFLKQTGLLQAGFTLRRLEVSRGKPCWLTRAEIWALYEATADTVLGIRDRAMLAVFYGCGLRLNEGACLKVTDILADRRIIHVTRGKRYRERFVPLARRDLEAIGFYIDYARPQLLQQPGTTSLFIDANKGHPMQRQSLYVRIRGLVKKAGIHKKVGTHTLRHSIASHLLSSGMKLEQIQLFLGHRNLDSTQIYTHLSSDPS